MTVYSVAATSSHRRYGLATATKSGTSTVASQMVIALTTTTSRPSERRTNRPTMATTTGRAKRLASTIIAANQAIEERGRPLERHDRGALEAEREWLRDVDRPRGPGRCR